MLKNQHKRLEVMAIKCRCSMHLRYISNTEYGNNHGQKPTVGIKNTINLQFMTLMFIEVFNCTATETVSFQRDNAFLKGQKVQIIAR